ncbi:hypothetical protein GQ53DRAFT_824689 [Thozetella sp. PMI_491]|nr:hypothetical protein GQ53DRAFT_824689 [Thozetella sp. PMI_491]
MASQTITLLALLGLATAQAPLGLSVPTPPPAAEGRRAIIIGGDHCSESQSTVNSLLAAIPTEPAAVRNVGVTDGCNIPSMVPSIASQFNSWSSAVSAWADDARPTIEAAHATCALDIGAYSAPAPLECVHTIIPGITWSSGAEGKAGKATKGVFTVVVVATIWALAW